jgi:hypothetical protein
MNVPNATLITVLLLLSAAPFRSAACAGDTPACGSEAVKASATSSPVATAAKSAILPLPDESAALVRPTALEVTARPIAGDDLPYLVGVFVGDPNQSNAQLIGSFSFFPPRSGEAQTFVLPAPEMVEKRPTLWVKLIPANPERDIKDAAVEILSARLIRE